MTKNTDVPLREYIQAILDAHDETHAVEHEQVKLAATQLEQRVEGLNQLRQDVVSDRGLFVTKEVVDGLLSANLERVAAARKEADQKADALAAADDALAHALAEKTQALAQQMDARIKPLENTAVTQTALASIKRVIYTTGFATVVAIALAIYSATRPK